MKTSLLYNSPIALPVDRLSDEERVAEAAEILAQGVIRFLNTPKETDSPLDFMPTQSVHGNRYHNGETQP